MKTWKQHFKEHKTFSYFKTEKSEEVKSITFSHFLSNYQRIIHM